MDFALGMLVGLLLGATAGVSFAVPAFGRVVAKVLSVILLGVGTAALVWPLALIETGEPLRGPFGSNVILYRSEAFAWAAGMLVAGAVGTVFSFLRFGPVADRAAN